MPAEFDLLKEASNIGARVVTDHPFPQLPPDLTPDILGREAEARMGIKPLSKRSHRQIIPEFDLGRFINPATPLIIAESVPAYLVVSGALASDNTKILIGAMATGVLYNLYNWGMNFLARLDEYGHH